MTPVSIVKKEIDNSHYYWVNGDFMPSVTRILDEAGPKEYGLINFFKQNTPDEIEQRSSIAKENGTIVHDTCEKLLNGVEIITSSLPNASKKAIASFIDWYNLVLPTDYATEQTVASLQYKFAGTLDMVCTINGKRCIVDFKTNKSAIYKSNYWQIAAYKQAYEETTGEKIDECYILRLGTTHKVGYEFKQSDNTDIYSFMHVYELYLSLHDGKIPQPPVVDVLPDILKLENISLKK
jgi:hypothetical protein